MPFQTQLSPMRWSTSWHRCRSPSTSTVGASPKKTLPGNSQLPWFTIMTLFHDLHLRDSMGDFWNLLSVNSDLEGMEFISTLEAKDFPFYATQVHELSSLSTSNVFPHWNVFPFSSIVTPMCIPSSTLRRTCSNGLPSTQASPTPGNKAQWFDQQRHQPYNYNGHQKQYQIPRTWQWFDPQQLTIRTKFREATSVSLYMVEHFVEAARQSSHQFPSRSHFIFDVHPVYPNLT